ncbi:hypothetical protein JCM15519_28150 [Fundidesulfovibrio butyratiphilus]
MKHRIPHWLDEVHTALPSLTGRDAVAFAVMAATLEHLGYAPGATLLAPSSKSPKARLREAVDLQLAHYRRELAGQTVLVFWVFEDFLSTTQQVDLAHEILGDGRFPVVFLLTNRWPDLEAIHADPVFCGHNPLYLPDRELVREIDFASVFWAIDCLYDTALPPGSVRLLQPHGTDILFDYSVEFYGAGLLFDCLMSPSFVPGLYRPDARERYRGLLPRCLADHDRDRLTAFEVGSFKLERFARRCRERTPSDIIYNLSSWQLEHPAIKSGLTDLLGEILARHGDRRLVFRCFPGNEDQVKPHIQPHLGHPRFFWSTAETYIDDYADGAALIHHRGSSAEIFSAASGRPSIKLDFFEPHRPEILETPTGYQVHDREQLFAALDRCLAPDCPKTRAIAAWRKTKYPHLGQSLTRVLDAIPDLIAGRVLPSWRTLPLDPTPEGMTDREFVRQAVETALRRDVLIPILGERAARLLPDSALVHFYAAKAIITHVYPDPAREDDTWLTAVEHLAQAHRLAPTGDLPDDMLPDIKRWCVRFLPARLIGLMAWSAHRHTSEQRERLMAAFRTLPFEFFHTDGLPQRLEEDRRRQEDRRNELEAARRALTRRTALRTRFVVSPLFLDLPDGNDETPLFVADPFLAERAHWDPGLSRLAGKPSAPWPDWSAAKATAINDRANAAAESLGRDLGRALDAHHPGGPRGERFWEKALGLGLFEAAHVLHDCFTLFETHFDPERHEALTLDPACYHVPLDFDALRWFLQHSDFGMEQAFSLYMRALRPETPCRLAALRYHDPYRVRSVGEPTRSNPVVGLLGTFPAEPFQREMTRRSRGDVDRIGFRRDLGLQTTPADIPRRLDLLPQDRGRDRFDRYLRACLPWLLPKSLLENFATLERSIERDFAPQTRLTHVVSEFWIGESYECLALAVLERRGVRHVYNEHVMSCAPFRGSIFPLHAQRCDLYAADTTVDRPQDPAYLPTGSLYDFAATAPEPAPARKATYFSANPLARTVVHGGQDCAVARGAWAPPYFAFKRRFFAALPERVRLGLVYRRYPYDDFFRLATLFWNDAAVMSPLLDLCPLDDHSLNARQAIACSGVVLTDQFSTSLIESAVLDRPSLVLLHDSDVFDPEFVPLMDELKRAGIVHDDPEEAAAFLERIWDDPQAWWSRAETQTARSHLLDTFMGRPERAVDLLVSLARGETPTKAPVLSGFVCPNPFVYAELRPEGRIAPCCYLEPFAGDIRRDGLETVWNSPRAKALRASILDGSYRFCDPARCAGMQKALAGLRGETVARAYQTPYELMRASELDAAGLGWLIRLDPRAPVPAPSIVSLEDDPTCTLSCPSCRTAPLKLDPGESLALSPIHQDLADRLDRAGGELWLCGAGDPFASPAYRNFLETFDPTARPRLRLRIDTNADLLTPKMWARTWAAIPSG